MTKSRGILAPRVKWLPEELQILRDRYPNQKTKFLADALGKTESQTYQKAAALGLKKSPEYLASPDACRLRRGDNVGAAHRFKPGQTTWNKGTHFAAGGRSLETRFKPGSTPANVQPVGHIRINGEGYQDIKTAPGPRNWVPLHHWNWKQEHGEYPPKGMALAFKDGNRMNCAVENLELLSRSELMSRNTRHRFPKEIADVIALRAAVTRQINKRIRNEQ